MKFIIDFKNHVSLEEIESYFVSNNITVIKEFNQFKKLYLIESVQTPPNIDIIESIIEDDSNSIKLLDTVTIISDQLYGKKNLNEPIIVIEHNEQNWWKTYTIKNIDFENSYSINRRGNNSTVYVLDSGIETSHQEFANQNVLNFWSFNNDFTDNKGHGTAIASVIVGQTTGINNCTVKSVKIFDKDTLTKQSDLLTALDNIFNDVYVNQIDFAIVNCSWSIPKNNFIENKIRIMIENGIFFVAASGNNGGPIENVTPASMPEVITVGAYDRNLKPCNFSAYSNSIISFTEDTTNYGELDIWAPGEQIYAAALNNRYGYAHGTSMSAAIQTAALVYNFSFVEINWKLDQSFDNFAKSVCYPRKDLLDLVDPRYSNSKNFITTILDEVPHRETLGYQWLIKTKSNQTVLRNLFVPSLVVKLELFAALPKEYTITSSGKFYGRSPQITQDFTIDLIPAKITLVDGSVIEADLEIINQRDDFISPVDDLILNGKLSITRMCTDAGCISPFQGDNCQDDCSGFSPFSYCVEQYDPKGPCGPNDIYCYCN